MGKNKRKPNPSRLTDPSGWCSIGTLYDYVVGEVSEKKIRSFYTGRRNRKLTLQAIREKIFKLIEKVKEKNPTKIFDAYLVQSVRIDSVWITGNTWIFSREDLKSILANWNKYGKSYPTIYDNFVKYVVKPLSQNDKEWSKVDLKDLFETKKGRLKMYNALPSASENNNMRYILLKYLCFKYFSNYYLPHEFMTSFVRYKDLFNERDLFHYPANVAPQRSQFYVRVNSLPKLINHVKHSKYYKTEGSVKRRLDRLIEGCIKAHEEIGQLSDKELPEEIWGRGKVYYKHKIGELDYYLKVNS